MSALPPPPLDYHTPPRPRRQIFSLPVFIVSGSIILITYGVLVYVFPAIERMYADFGVHLPRFTMLVLDIARFAQQRGLLVIAVIPFILALVVPFALGGRRASLTRSARWIIALVMLNILLATALALVLIVWVLPMYKLLKDMLR